MRNLPLKLARLIHSFYKRCISPCFGSACRFEPSCSDYAIEAIEKHGFIRGALLGIWRVLRCNPYSKGGKDPVPERF